MRKYLSLVALFGMLGLATLTVQCAITPGPLAGGLFSSYKMPQDAANATVGSKVGESCASSVLGIIAFGDASAVTAAKAGGITKIATVDTNRMNVLSLFASVCTNVTGE